VVLVYVLEPFKAVITDNQVGIHRSWGAGKRVLFPRRNLESILQNLISNAIKYRSPIRPSEVWVGSNVLDGKWCLVVRDNGLAVDLAQHQDKLFGMFNRFHTHVGGSGVGLYIVHKLVTDSGGHIQVESEVGQGTTFRLFLAVEVEIEDATTAQVMVE